MSQKQRRGCRCGRCMARDPQPPAPPPAAPEALNAASRAWERQCACLTQSGSHLPPPRARGTRAAGGGVALPERRLCERRPPSRCSEARLLCRVDLNDPVGKHFVSHRGGDGCGRVHLCPTQHEGDVVRFCCLSRHESRGAKGRAGSRVKRAKPLSRPRPPERDGVSGPGRRVKRPAV